MSCKNKNNENKNKEKNIVCENCVCVKDDNNKIKVECSNCENCEDLTIICESCDCNIENDKTKLCLKDCECDGSKESCIHITCDNYKEDLD